MIVTTVLKPKDVINSLLKKGFQVREGSHKFFVYYTDDGKKTAIHTMVSQNNREIDDYLIGAMSSQVKLDKKKFMELVQCSLTKDMYLNELVKQGAIKI